MMKGTCNPYRIIAVGEKILRKCCQYIIKVMIKMMKRACNFYRKHSRS